MDYVIITEKDVERLTQIPRVPTKMFGIHFPDNSDFDDIIETLNDPWGDPDVQLVMCKSPQAEEIYAAVEENMRECILDEPDKEYQTPVSCVVIALYELDNGKSLLVYFDYQLDYRPDLLIELTDAMFQSGPEFETVRDLHRRGHPSSVDGLDMAQCCHFDLDQINDNPDIMEVLQGMGVDYEED